MIDEDLIKELKDSTEDKKDISGMSKIFAEMVDDIRICGLNLRILNNSIRMYDIKEIVVGNRESKELFFQKLDSHEKDLERMCQLIETANKELTFLKEGLKQYQAIRSTRHRSKLNLRIEPKSGEKA